MFDFIKEEKKPLEKIVQRKMEYGIKTDSEGLEWSDRGVIQAKRKVVSKEDDSIENAILWDKNRHKFFKNMRSYPDSNEPDNLIYKIKTGNVEDEASEAKGKFQEGMYKDNSDKDKVGLNEVLLEYDETHFVETNKVNENMRVYGAGEEVTEEEEPFTIRLYAEGNMDHALGLAEGMERYLGQDRDHSKDIFPFDKMRGKKVLIKSTEFRRLSEVEEAYRSESREAFQGREMEFYNWEGSFGGSTGDMMKAVQEGEHRKYDLIQTTFFWIQGYQQDEIEVSKNQRDKIIKKLREEILTLNKGIGKCNKEEKERRNNEIRKKGIEIELSETVYRKFCERLYKKGNELSYQIMITFVKEQLKKLKPTGEIRIVVSNINPYAQIKEKLETEIARLKGSEDGFYSNIEIQTIELNKTYPMQLQEEGLNEVGFEQRQTKKMKTVTGRANGENIGNDLIIIIRREEENEPPEIQ